MAPDQLPDPLAVALEIAALLDLLDIPYVAAGSVASSVHGEPRSTNDVDLVVDLMHHRLPQLLATLGDRWYVSPEAAADAVRTGGSFNLIHYATAVKVDLFVAGEDPFDAERLAHRQGVRIGPAEHDILHVDTAEHTILRKLEWYRRGGEVSERQWRDVTGVVRVQGDTLDWNRMAAWATRLGVGDLLERARHEGLPHAEGRSPGPS